MKVLFVLPAETIYDQQNRVMGWRQTPSPRAKLKELKALVPRLKELGADRVICSDLDGQSGWTLARTMGLRCEEWMTARRFNWGKHHGQPKTKAEKEWETLQERWKVNPDIPVHNGDSLSSYRKRLETMKERFKKQAGTAIVLLGPFEIQNLLGTKASLERGRVYEWSAQASA